MLAAGPSLQERERELARAIDRGYFANKGLIDLLDIDRMPLSASVEAGMAYYAGEDGAPGPNFRLWLWARAMALIVDAHDDLRGVKHVTPPPVEIEQPDEAPGLTVEADPALTADQPRLGLG
jgi:hypothetical protein